MSNPRHPNSDSNRSALVDTRVLQNQEDRDLFLNDMKKTNVKTVYLYHDSLFDPNDSLEETIKKGVSLVTLQKGLKPQSGTPDVQVSSTISQVVFDSLIERFKSIRDYYEFTTDKTPGNPPFDQWFKDAKNSNNQIVLQEMRLINAKIDFVNTINTPLQKNGKRPMMMKDMVEYGKDPTSLTVYAPQQNSHVYFYNKEKIDLVSVDIPDKYSDLHPLRKSAKASASVSQPTKAGDSQPEVLVDMQIFKSGSILKQNDLTQFTRGMLEDGFSNIYVHNDKLFAPGNDVKKNIIEGVALLETVQNLNSSITNQGGAKIYPTSSNPLATAVLTDCKRLNDAYEKFKNDAIKMNHVPVDFNEWLERPEVKKSDAMRHLNTLFEKPQPDNRTISLDHMQPISLDDTKQPGNKQTISKPPTSLLIFAANGSTTKYKEDEVPTKKIDVEKNYVPPGEGSQPVKYTEQRKDHLNQFEAEHNKKMESIKTIISNIESRMDSLISNYKGTKTIGLGWLAHNNSKVSAIKKEFEGIIAHNLRISPQEKLKQLMYLMMKYYSPKDGKKTFEATLNDQKNDHYFKRNLGLTMKEAYDALKSVQGNNVTLPKEIERVSALIVPNTAAYNTFSSDLSQGKESPRMGRNSRG